MTAIVDVARTAPAGLKTQPLDDYPFWKIVGARPVTGERADYASADGRFHVGYSQYSEMTLELKDWPGDEFMLLLEGRVEITGADGVTKKYGPGDMFVMPKGFSGTWRQDGPLRKINIIYGWGE